MAIMEILPNNDHASYQKEIIQDKLPEQLKIKNVIVFAQSVYNNCEVEKVNNNRYLIKVNNCYVAQMIIFSRVLKTIIYKRVV